MDGIKYRKAEEMKDSGIKWIGNIPQDWEVKKLKYVARVATGNTPSKNTDEFYCSTGTLWVKPDNLADFKIIKETKEYLNNGGTKLARIAKPYAVLICCIGTVGKFGYSDQSVAYNQQINAVEFLGNKVDWKFGLYFMSCQQEQQRYYMNGNVVLILNTDNQKKVSVSVPPLSIQQTIANFLDIKTAQFNSIISNKELLIEKLEEAKKSLISEVVTGKVKIVDGEIVKRQPEEMKNSGIEWLGMIPKEWVVKRIKNLFSLRNERNHKSMDEVQILSLYTALGVKRQEEIENKTGNVVRTVLDYKIVHPQDIVVNIILAWMGAIGVSQDKGVISPAYDIYKPYDNINSDYYSYLFRTSKFAGECFKYGRGIMLMRWRTYSDQFMSIYCCCPNKTEQDQIAEFIDRKIRDIDTVVEKNKLQIQKLKEAKQSLISEAVTGKIDLRDWEIIEEGGLQ